MNMLTLTQSQQDSSENWAKEITIEPVALINQQELALFG